MKRMLKWYSNLYVGEQAQKNISRVKCRLNLGKMQMGMFLITYASNPENLLEIIATEQLLQRTVYRRCPLIVGVGASREEALQIVLQIVEETYAAQGDADVRRYLQMHEKKKRRRTSACSCEKKDSLRNEQEKNSRAEGDER